jgi:hypothetical protein
MKSLEEKIDNNIYNQINIESIPDVASYTDWSICKPFILNKNRSTFQIIDSFKIKCIIK